MKLRFNLKKTKMRKFSSATQKKINTLSEVIIEMVEEFKDKE